VQSITASSPGKARLGKVAFSQTPAYIACKKKKEEKKKKKKKFYFAKRTT